jgi:hypothetical protein
MPTRARILGTLVDTDNRTLHYRLIPFGEEGLTNLGRVTVGPGVIELPDDPDEHVLNREHDPTRPIARASRISQEDDGIHAWYPIPRTPAGEALLAEHTARLRTGISAEIEDCRIRGGRLVAGRLDGAAATVDPAWASARLIASRAPDTPDQTPDDDDHDEFDDDDDTPDDTSPDTGDNDTPGDPTMPPVTTPTTDPPAPPADPPTPDEDDTGGVPLRASAPRGLPARAGGTSRRTGPSRTGPSLAEVSRRLAAVTRASMGAQSIHAALADITPAAGSVDDTVAAVPQWLGELWDGRDFVQRYVPLMTSAPLTSMTVQGWRWTVKPEVAPYAGNKAAVPSNPATTEPYTDVAQRIAGAHDIDRIFFDFSNEEFWASYWANMTESYARESDVVARDALIAGAPYVAPGAAVAGIAKAAVYLVDGVLAVIDTAVPSWAVVSKDLYRELLLTPADQVLAYLTMAVGWDEGTAAGFRLVPGDAGFPADTVLVGTPQASKFRQLPGVPIRVESLNVAQAGIDAGLFGYCAAHVEETDALALVSGTVPVPDPEADDQDTGDDKPRSRRGRITVGKG